MGTVLPLALGAALALCAALALSGLVQVARARGWLDASLWDGPLAFTSAALALLTALGVLAPLPGALLALAPLLVMAVTAYPSWRALAAVNGKGAASRHVLAGIAAHVRDSVLTSRDDARGLRLRRQDPGRPPQAAPPAPPTPTPAAAVPSAPREVPPLREDQALAPVPHPAEVAAGLAGAGVEVPEPYRLLADWIAGQDPETDADQSRFLAGVAAGKIAEAEAWQAHGENMVTGVGLDPSYGAAVFDLADSCAEHASDAVLVDRRYHVIYGEVKRAVENGLILPHRARQFFGGSSGESAA